MSRLQYNTCIFKKEPIFEYVQFTGNNVNQVRDFLDVWAKIINRRLRVPTEFGCVFADEGDYILKYDNHFLLCKEKDFEKEYAIKENL